MKCPHCGTENRPEVRFCKGCGQPLKAESAMPSPASLPPASSGRSCPHCGSAVKPQARFCPRCGETLPPPAEPQAQTQPQQAPQQSQQPPQSQTPSRYTQPQQQPPPVSKTQPQPSGIAQQPTHDQPQTAPPQTSSAPPTSSSDGQSSGIPTWLWIAIGLIVGILLLGGAFLGFKLLSNDDGETPTATPTEETAPTEDIAAPGDPTETVAASPIITLTGTPTLPLKVTVTSTPTQIEATTTPRPEDSDTGAGTVYTHELTINQPPPELKVNDFLTLTATITNTGEVGFGVFNFDLQGDEWRTYLTPTRGPEFGFINPMIVSPGEHKEVSFILQAIREGQTDLQLVAMLVGLQMSEFREPIEADPVQVIIVP